jgi:spore germination protein
MDIYIVQPGDTIFSIAEKFNVPYQRLIYDNNISPAYNIVNGQIIIITYPEVTYFVQDGDSIQSITSSYGITPLQLIQNNPFLLDRDYFNIGEELIISFQRHEQPFEVNAYTYSYVNLDVLQKALSYLTYLTIVDYRLNEQGSIEIPNDSSVIEMAKEFGVAPIMMLSGISEQGQGSYGITHKLFNNIDQQNSLIDNLLYTLREKDLSGINFGFQNVLPEDLQGYTNFITNASEKLRPEGYYIFATLLPDTFGYDPAGGNDQNPYYAQIGQVVDGVILLSYQFTNAYLPAVEQTTLPYIRSYAEFVVTQIPPEKIFISFTRIAYDWELPYVENQSPVAALSNFDAIRLASDLEVTMGFDEYHLTPYYYYDRGGIQHFVWFKDARTVNAITNIIEEYNLKGISIWNVMDFTPQLWTTLNSQHKIAKVLNVTSEFL